MINNHNKYRETHITPEPYSYWIEIKSNICNYLDSLKYETKFGGGANI